MISYYYKWSSGVRFTGKDDIALYKLKSSVSIFIGICFSSPLSTGASWCCRQIIIIKKIDLTVRYVIWDQHVCKSTKRSAWEVQRELNCRQQALCYDGPVCILLSCTVSKTGHCSSVYKVAARLLNRVWIIKEQRAVVLTGFVLWEATYHVK